MKDYKQAGYDYCVKSGLKNPDRGIVKKVGELLAIGDVYHKLGFDWLSSIEFAISNNTSYEEVSYLFVVV